MNNLPFLKPKGFPKLRKCAGVSRYGFSEDDDIIEHALDELMSAIDAKDNTKMVDAIKALVGVIRNKESRGNDATSPL